MSVEKSIVSIYKNSSINMLGFEIIEII